VQGEEQQGEKEKSVDAKRHGSGKFRVVSRWHSRLHLQMFSESGHSAKGIRQDFIVLSLHWGSP
jgi:hypothetical protein